jgi:ubiquinone biosynthesis protein
VIAGLTHLHRLGHAGFVFAREGVFGLVDPTRLPLPARAALRMARLIERPASRVSANRLATALTRLGPSYVKLG